MGINKQKFAILLGFLYSVAISADPFFHSFETDHDHDFVEIHEYMDCQVCETESFKAYDIQVLEEYALVQKTHTSLEQRVETRTLSGFSARAPPNS